MLLTMVIPGPKNPSKSLDVFLQPLIHEFKTLWTKGVSTHDIHNKQNFQMKAALLWIISNFFAYGILSRQSTHRKLACTYCMKSSKAFVLQYRGKSCFFVCHCQFLPLNYIHIRKKDKFRKNVIERSPLASHLLGDAMKHRVNSLPNITFGTISRKQTIHRFRVNHIWIKMNTSSRSFGIGIQI